MTILGQDRTLEEGLAKTVVYGKKRKRIALYARTSSDDQRERETIRTQIDALYRFLNAAGDTVELVGEFFDDGISGTLPMEERPRGRAMLDACTAGLIDEVWVTRPNRIGRKTVHILNAVEAIEHCGATVVGLLDPLDNRFILTIKAAVAEEERRVFLENSREGMERAAREGRFCGGIVPFGYVVPEKKEKARLVPDTTPFWEGKSATDLVVWMYELVAVERWTPARVAAHLNLLGVPTHYSRDGRSYKNPRRGKRLENTDGLWRSSRVRALLLNTVYRGAYRYGKNPPKRKDGTKPVREILTGPCARIVSDELWEAARASMATRRSWDPSNHKKHLLRSLVVCAHCGLNYSGGSSHGKSWYRCNGRTKDNIVRRGRCFGQALDGTIIEPLIQRDICDWLLFPGDILDELLYELQDEPGSAVEETERVLVQSRLDGIGTRRKKAIQLNLSGLITDAELADQLAEIDREREALEALVVEVPAKRGPKADRPMVAEDLIEQLRETVEEGFTEDQWRDLVTQLVKRIVVHTEDDGGHRLQRVVIEYNFVPQNESGVALNHRGTRVGQNSTTVSRILQIPVGARGRRK